MDIDIIEERFSSYLDEFCSLSELKPFRFACIRLLLLFKNELSAAELDGVVKRQGQLRGEEFEGRDLEVLMKSVFNELSGFLKNNTSTTRAAQLNRLLFCALLDTEETDFSYLTEPIFEFAETMQVSPDQLKDILESEFIGFKV